jgi:hypothetical protein
MTDITMIDLTSTDFKSMADVIVLAKTLAHNVNDPFYPHDVAINDIKTALLKAFEDGVYSVELPDED